ncbi:MAG: ABC transporter substrate-binding protein [Deltaproteobacteria bacterium]|jgi:iron complex transport system substrate-binding protein|nr:ABC transporter substrate-binding protein [Deltaproteobacteria bacterium]
MSTKRFFPIVAILLAFLLSACENKTQDISSLKPLSVVEMDGYTLAIDLFNRKIAIVPRGEPLPQEVLDNFKPTAIVRTPVEKIIVASGTYDPSIIIGLGKGDAIIGVTDSRDEFHSPEMLKLFDEGKVKYIGEYNSIDLESLVEMKPDVILISSTSTLELVEFLGFPVVADYSNEVNDIENQLELISFLGMLLGEKEKGDKRVQELKASLKAIGERVEGLHRPKLTWGVYFDKRVFVLGGDYWVADLLEIVGADYVFPEIDMNGAGFSLEEFYIRSKDADIFFITQPSNDHAVDMSLMLKWYDGLKDMKAFGDQGTVAMTYSWLWENAWYVDEIAMDLGAVVHPELYPDRKLTYVEIIKEK